jgi:putative peptidoglycan lipid II flippase
MRRFERTDIVICALVAVLSLGAALTLSFSSGHASSIYGAQGPPASAPSEPKPAPPPDEPAAPVVETIQPTHVADYDPRPGDRREHPELLDLAIDGDPQTAWSTETYRPGQPSNGKKGVGIAFAVGEPVVATALELQTDTPGWSGEVYSAGRDIGGWDRQVGTIENASRRETIPLDIREPSRFFLVWISDLGDRHAADVNEVRLVTGPAAP